MAAEAGKRHGAPDGDVSNCVSNLVHAFVNGLDIFKKLREQRRKRKSRKHGAAGQSEQASSAELQLSNSLRKGPMDIQSSYHDHYSKAGHHFAKGDDIAHRSLAETLVKLNTGLVGIIAAFLNHDAKSKNHLDLDYKSLTNLSEASRAEAIESLNQLYQRLSHSQLHIYRIGACPRCGSSKHQNCSGRALESSAKSRRENEKQKHARSRTTSNGHTIAKIPIKSSSQPQLVVMRPRNTRKNSASSSSSSTKSPPTPLTSPYASPLGSPLPQYTPKDPFPPQSSQPSKAQSKSSAGKRRTSTDGPRPTTWPHTIPEAPIPLNLPPPRPPKIPITPPKEKYISPSATPIVKRRADKVTPSTYTFASGSTKLGEIPQKNWSTPWNYDEAERMNAEAAVAGYSQPEGEERPKARKGLFKFLRRGSGAE